MVLNPFQGNKVPNSVDGQGAAASRVRTWDVVGYLFLPRILPRITQLFFSGFAFFAFFMAQVYRGVRLLPEGHAFLNPSNVGQYGVRDVISAAASHLVFRRENIDQIIIFFAILIGLLLLVIQAGLFVAMMAMPQASAQMIGQYFGDPIYQGLTQNAGTSQDLAFIMLDRVFGVGGIFHSCISENIPCFGAEPSTMNFDTENVMYKPSQFPWPYHHGLHAMFQFYSMALLMVGMIIILYYAIVIVVETAQTGVPFGKRFNSVWAPIRLVMAIGLLIPLGSGLNAAQYITLYVAKFGSNFASNGWLTFNRETYGAASNMVQGSGLVAEPQASSDAAVKNMVNFMVVAHGCKAFEETLPVKDYTPAAAAPAAASSGGAAAPAPAATGATPTAAGAASTAVNNVTKCPKNDDMEHYTQIDAYLVHSSFDFSKSNKPLMGTSFEDAQKFSQNGDIKIRFGDQACSNVAQVGYVAPLCGEIILPATSMDTDAAKKIQEGYYKIIQNMWGGYGLSGGAGSTAGIKTYTNTSTQGKTDRWNILCKDESVQKILDSGSGDKILRGMGIYSAAHALCGDKIKDLSSLNSYADPALLAKAPIAYRVGDGNVGSNGQVGALPGYDGVKSPDLIVKNIIAGGVKSLQDEIRNDGRGGKYKYSISPDAMARGWAAAGIWYNKIAQMNGSLTSAAWNFPTPSRLPRLLQQGASQQMLNGSAVQRENTQQGGSDPMNQNFAEETAAIKAYDQVIMRMREQQSSSGRSSGSVLGDIINNLFGIDGLFDMASQTNKGAHPLAQLVGVGRGLIEASIRNMSMGLAVGVGGVVVAGVSGYAGGMLDGITGAASSISGLLFSIATITLTAGFLLYYVVPFLPFLYFFFAVGNWLKGVFEAMVGVPLWALAHLRIDGNGLPGDAAIGGYFMLFEIFLRPILIVFGLLASITIFAAMGAVLGEIYQGVVSNLTGANAASETSLSSIDNLFYTIMYAVIMYMMALSSFKLIDLIPNQIMRWMGTNVSTFSDMAGDPAQTLTQYTAIAGSQIVGQVTGGVQQFVGGMQGAAKSLGGAAGKLPKNR